MNKTFLLSAQARYTEGTHLLVIDSVKEFVSLFKEYHTKKRDFLLEKAPLFYERSERDIKNSNKSWSEIVDERNKLHDQFISENNCKPFNFEITTGCCYIKEGKGKDNFYNNIIIVSEYALTHGRNCWYVEKEFMSDLPRGTHYLGDYCA